MSAITFEQQQIFKDAIYELQISIDAVLYGVRVDSFEHQRRNFEALIELSSIFGRVFDSIPAFSNRFRELFQLLNMSRSIFLENKVELFLSRVQAVFDSWCDSLNPLPSSVFVHESEYSFNDEYNQVDDDDDDEDDFLGPESVPHHDECDCDECLDSGRTTGVTWPKDDDLLPRKNSGETFAPLTVPVLLSATTFGAFEHVNVKSLQRRQGGIQTPICNKAPEGLAGYAVAGYIFKTLTVNRLHRLGVFTFDQLYEYTQRDLVSDGLEFLVFNRQSSRRFIADINESLELRGFPTLRVS